MDLQETETTIQFRLRKPPSEVTQDVVGVVLTAMESTEFSLEDLGVEQRRVPTSRSGEGGGRIEVHVARTGNGPRPEPD